MLSETIDSEIGSEFSQISSASQIIMLIDRRENSVNEHLCIESAAAIFSKFSKLTLTSLWLIDHCMYNMCVGISNIDVDKQINYMNWK